MGCGLLVLTWDTLAFIVASLDTLETTGHLAVGSESETSVMEGSFCSLLAA